MRPGTVLLGQLAVFPSAALSTQVWGRVALVPVVVLMTPCAFDEPVGKIFPVCHDPLRGAFADLLLWC